MPKYFQIFSVPWDEAGEEPNWRVFGKVISHHIEGWANVLIPAPFRKFWRGRLLQKVSKGQCHPKTRRESHCTARTTQKQRSEDYVIRVNPDRAPSLNNRLQHVEVRDRIVLKAGCERLGHITSFCSRHPSLSGGSRPSRAIFWLTGLWLHPSQVLDLSLGLTGCILGGMQWVLTFDMYCIWYTFCQYLFLFHSGESWVKNFTWKNLPALNSWSCLRGFWLTLSV